MKMNLLLNLIVGLLIFYEINGLPVPNVTSTTQTMLYENLTLSEADMLFPPTQLRGDSIAWTNGIVPYEILSGYESDQEDFIVATMQKMERQIAIQNVACVQFRPRLSSDLYYITIVNSYGCSSSVGQNTGINMQRTVTLQGPECMEEGLIMHQLLHTLGFYHEQSRLDRDNYVTIIVDNIFPGYESSFDKYNNSYFNIVNTPYDYTSIMHFDAYAFSVNALPTIVPLQANVSIGQRYNMSTIDIQQVRLFYNCSSTGITFPTIPTTTIVNLYSVNTTISSSLTTNSQTYIRYLSFSQSSYYYETFEVNVTSSGYYIITSNSLMDTYGYLYEQNFISITPDVNLLQYDDDSGGNSQFQITSYLQAQVKYIVVASTFFPLVTGSYTLIVSGLIKVNLQKILIPSITTISTSTTTPTSTLSATTLMNIFSTYSSALTTASPTFDRNGFTSGDYYYEAILISVSQNGYYSLLCGSNVDTYGYLYLNSFNPVDITQNLINQDDDDGGNSQFLITYNLQTMNTYILITSTFYSNMITSYSITASGPGTVNCTHIDIQPVTNGPTTTTTRSTTTTKTTTTTRPTTITTRSTTTTTRSTTKTTTTTRPTTITTTTTRLTTTTTRPTTITTTTTRLTTTTTRPTTTTTTRSTTTTTTTTRPTTTTTTTRPTTTTTTTRPTTRPTTTSTTTRPTTTTTRSSTTTTTRPTTTTTTTTRPTTRPTTTSTTTRPTTTTTRSSTTTTTRPTTTTTTTTTRSTTTTSTTTRPMTTTTRSTTTRPTTTTSHAVVG